MSSHKYSDPNTAPVQLWQLENWKTILAPQEPRRTGLRLRFDTAVDPEVRRAYKDFAQWLRQSYFFPLRVPVYIKSARRIQTMDGDLVIGSFFEPFNHNQEPYVRVSTGDYPELLEKMGRDNALASLLHTFAHELSHYFQWINDVSLTDRGREQQATRCAKKLLSAYACTRDHP